MVDRIARDRIASILRTYMNEEITAFQLDDRLEEFRPFPTDRTVECIANDLWGCYDDCKDHKVVASKQTWDFFNRILLLLASDAEIEQVRDGLQWSTTEIFAGVCFVLIVTLLARIGWSSLPMLSIPFGVVSIAIWTLSGKRLRKSPDHGLYPFPSLAVLSFVRRSVRTFSKSALPKVVGSRRIRHPLIGWIYWALLGSLWLLFSPIVLFIQALPKSVWKTRVKTIPDYCS